MKSNIPQLDITVLPTYNSTILAIADISYYPDSWNIVTPTISITAPGFQEVVLPFVARSMQIYNAETLGIICPDGICTNFPIPDGIYNIKYCINPCYSYFIEKTFLRVDALVEKYDTAYIKLDILQCDLLYKREQKKELELIWAYINGAIASANECALKQAMDLYVKADTMMDDFLKNFDRKHCKVW